LHGKVDKCVYNKKTFSVLESSVWYHYDIYVVFGFNGAFGSLMRRVVDADCPWNEWGEGFG